MDEARFDRLTRLIGRGASRRQVAKTVAGGALAAAVLGRFEAGAGRAQEASPAASPCPATTSEESAAIARAYFDAFNNGDAEALGALLAPDYVHHGALVTDQDRELHMERLLQNRGGFPDGHYELAQIIADGDLVAIRNIFTGTLQAPYAGVEPAGQEVAVRAVHIHRIECGLIVETWNSGDALGLLRQIGALPPAGPSPRTPLNGGTAPATPTGDCPTTTPEENAAIVRRWTEEALDQHNLDILDEIVSEDVVHHAGLFVDEIGRDQLKADLQALLDGFPDSRWTADVVVTQDDMAAVRWTGTGTHEGEFLGIEPTGKSVVLTGINVYRLACGLIVEGWSEPDSLGLLRQLDAIPETPPPVSTPTA